MAESDTVFGPTMLGRASAVGPIDARSAAVVAPDQPERSMPERGKRPLATRRGVGVQSVSVPASSPRHAAVA
jgi:hypothetical protein